MEQWCCDCKGDDLLNRSPWIIYAMVSIIRLIIYLPEDRASVPIIWYQIRRFTARYYLHLPLDFILCSSPTVHQKPQQKIHLFSAVLQTVCAIAISFLVCVVEFVSLVKFLLLVLRCVLGLSSIARALFLCHYPISTTPNNKSSHCTTRFAPRAALC